MSIALGCNILTKKYLCVTMNKKQRTYYWVYTYFFPTYQMIYTHWRFICCAVFMYLFFILPSTSRYKASQREKTNWGFLVLSYYTALLLKQNIVILYIWAKHFLASIRLTICSFLFFFLIVTITIVPIETWYVLCNKRYSRKVADFNDHSNLVSDNNKV